MRTLMWSGGLLCVALLSGCATYGPPAGAGPAHADASGLDARYISRVERKALRHGLQVHWVHPPRRPAAAGP